MPRRLVASLPISAPPPDLVGGQLGVEDQQPRVAAGGLLPVVSERDDLPGLFCLGDVGVCSAPAGRCCSPNGSSSPAPAATPRTASPRPQAGDLAQQMTAAGFANVHTEIQQAGRRTLIIIVGSGPQPRKHGPGLISGRACPA